MLKHCAYTICFTCLYIFLKLLLRNATCFSLFRRLIFLLLIYQRNLTYSVRNTIVSCRDRAYFVMCRHKKMWRENMNKSVFIMALRLDE